MRIPNTNCKIDIFCPVNLSEDPEKVKQAVANIFPYSIIKNENFSIHAQSKELRSLEKIYETIHKNKSQNIYIRNLENNLENDTTWFLLNKQAAFVDKIAICDEPEESPLGPIKVILTSSNIDAIIDWIDFAN
ncbi:RNA-binding domain-containing protein [Nitrosopumilus sp.]|uniref:RNA-binding domain-containing protein n=1 Tax=Nitrosopumilus sp. TaxID=2024843 RepID=UPI0034A09995